MIKIATKGFNVNGFKSSSFGFQGKFSITSRKTKYVKAAFISVFKILTISKLILILDLVEKASIKSS